MICVVNSERVSKIVKWNYSSDDCVHINIVITIKPRYL